MNTNPFEVLGVSSDAEDEEVKKAYHRKSLKCHPDLFPDDSVKAEEFRKLNEAFQMIETTAKRRLFSQKSGASLRHGAAGAHSTFYARMFRVSEGGEND